MHVLVCLKASVPSSAIVYDPHSGAPLRPVDAVVSGRDAVALQAALDLKRRPGARVTALCVGDSRADDVLRHALLAGADRAIRLWQREGDAALDTWAAATVAAAAMIRLAGDLAFCAAQSEDFGDEFFPAVLAAGADCELISRVVSLTPGDGGLEAVQKLEGGWRAGHRARLPAVVAVEPEFTRVRHHAVLGRVYRAGLERAVEVWTAEDVGLREWPRPLVTEIELALPRGRTRAVQPAAAQVSAKDRLRRKKAPAAEPAEASAWDGPADVVARRLLETFSQWLS